MKLADPSLTSTSALVPIRGFTSPMDVLLKHAGLASASGGTTEDSSLRGETNLRPLRIKLRLAADGR